LGHFDLFMMVSRALVRGFLVDRSLLARTSSTNFEENMALTRSGNIIHNVCETSR